MYENMSLFGGWSALNPREPRRRDSRPPAASAAVEPVASRSRLGLPEVWRTLASLLTWERLSHAWRARA